MRRPCTLACVLLACAGLSPPLAAGPSSEARNAAEVYERHRSLADAFRYVARDLAVRSKGLDVNDKPRLVLVVDPTPSLVAEVRVLAETVEDAFDEGPAGLRVGVVAAGAEETEPSGIPADARNALRALAFLPMPGRKNLLEAVRRGAALLGPAGGAPRAVLLVTEDGGDGEDDVERTREALLDAEAAFYAVAPESAFQRGWAQTFEPRDAAGLTERFQPEAGRRSEPTWYAGGETAFGLVPYLWELDLAQTEFTWVRPPRYPVPSGFGYWPLASLAFTTGGRYFVYDFTRPPGRAPAGRPRDAAPDAALRLRPAGSAGAGSETAPTGARDLSKDGRARTIVRIWQHLADEACPVVGMLGTVELVGGALRGRPTRPVRSTARRDVVRGHAGRAQGARLRAAASRRADAGDALVVRRERPRDHAPGSGPIPSPSASRPTSSCWACSWARCASTGSRAAPRWSGSSRSTCRTDVCG